MNWSIHLAEICFGAMVFSLPFTVLPVRYNIPVLGGNLPQIFLLFSIFFCGIYLINNRHVPNFPGKKYFIIFFLWSLFCLIWGCWHFPFYDAAINQSLRDSRMVSIFSIVFPSLKENIFFLHAKMFFSYFWYMLKGFFFPFIGVFFIVYTLFREGKIENLRKYLYYGIYGLSILMTLYSIPEIIWLWTGNSICAQLLSFINIHLYDPALYNNWWPPLLWKGQLRSICLEPSYFGIIVTFLVPFLAIDISRKFKFWKIVLIFILVFMIFMTKVRTATVIFLGESFVFLLASLFFRYSKWKIYVGIWFGIIICAFGIYLGGYSLLNQDTSTSELTEQYISENVTSVVGKDKRSNSARFGNTIAMLRIGIDYSLTGVGMGLHAPYMAERFPNFAQDNHEVKKWIQDMREKTFLESGVPVLNEYAAIWAWNGILGLFLFLLAPIHVIKRGLMRIQNHKSFEMVCLLTVLIGQMACMFSSEMFLTYPLALWIAYCSFRKDNNYGTTAYIDNRSCL